MVAMIEGRIKIGKTVQASAARAGWDERVGVLAGDRAAGEHLAIIEFVVAPRGDDGGMAGARVLKGLDEAVATKLLLELAALIGGLKLEEFGGGLGAVSRHTAAHGDVMRADRRGDNAAGQHILASLLGLALLQVIIGPGI